MTLLKPHTAKQAVALATLMMLMAACSPSTSSNGKDENVKEKKIRVVPSTYRYPSVSPDGKKIVFYRRKLLTYRYSDFGDIWATYDQDSTGLYMMNADGGNMKILAQGEYHDPEFSPDGKWVVYGMNKQIFKVPFDGDTIKPNKAVQLTHRGRNFNPRWSPDGEWITYRNTHCGTGPPEEPPEGQCGVLFKRADGSDLHDPDIPCMEADWGLDSNTLFCPGAKTIYGYKIEEDSLFVIAELPAVNTTYDLRTPAFSPVGDKVLFSNRSPYENFKAGIYAALLAERRNKPVIVSSLSRVHEYVRGPRMPGWFPNGKQMVYIDHVTSTIWMANSDGANRVQLTKNHGLEYEYYYE